MAALNLAQHLIDRIHQAYDLIKLEVPAGELYLFGSYAKRGVKPTSDIDLLVLIDEQLDKKVLRSLKWTLEEKIEEAFGFEFEIDLKIYTKQHFTEAKQTLGFESEIDKYMIKLEEDTWL